MCPTTIPRLDYTIRVATRNDVTDLYNIDLKCFPDYTWPPSMWHDALSAIPVVVAETQDRVVGFAVYTNDQPGGDFIPKKLLSPDVLWLMKLGVKNPYRNQGIGAELAFNTDLYALQVKANTIRVLIPESSCVPGHTSVAGFLQKMGYSPNMVQDGCFTEFGDNAAGVYWDKKIPVEIPKQDIALIEA